MSRVLYENFRWGLGGEPQEMLVDGGRVAARGLAVVAEGAKRVDLGGAYVLPALIDSHCHILPTGLDLAKLQLRELDSREQVLDAVRHRHADLPPEDWLHAVHYDQNRFSDSRHITRTDLDAISMDRPILLRHSNGHAGVANSAALQAAGITESSPDPRGGTFVRDSAGRPTGVLLETALERVNSASPMPTLDQMVDAILLAGDKISEHGIACATDMMTGSFDLDLELQAYRIALERGCRIRVRLFVQWSTVLGPKAASIERLEEFATKVPEDRGRIAGLKIFADGAIGSATAAIYGRYATTGENGQLIYSPERLLEMVRKADERGFSLAIHSIGDRSTDHVLDSFESLSSASRHRIEHVMLLSDAQIDRLAKVGCMTTMQPEFLSNFANSYRKQLGVEAASRLERFRSVKNAGISLALNSDRPIVAGDPWEGISAASCRPDGFDSSENLTRADAILAYTKEAARANGDDLMGTLEPGTLADFCTYLDDPLAVTRPQLGQRFLKGEPQDISASV